MSTVSQALKFKLVMILLVFWSLLFHFSLLSQPNEVVWDEYYFAKFPLSYFSHQYYFDIHPPLGKLMIAATVSAFGYKQASEASFLPGEEFPSDFFFALRFLPALFGSLFVLFFSWFVYLASRSKNIALFSGFLILFENAFLIQSKLVLLDIFLVTFGVLSFCFFLLYQRQKAFSKKWFSFIFLAGIFFGLSVSIKWTGLAVFGLIALASLIKLFSRRLAEYLSAGSGGGFEQESSFFRRFFDSGRIKEFVVSLFFLAVIGFLVYLVPFYIHFSLLDQPGYSARYIDLPASMNQIPPSGGFFHKFIQLNLNMYKVSSIITKVHLGSSRWYMWPLDMRPIVYWNETNLKEVLGDSETASIVFWGNPVLFLLVLISVIVTLLCAIIKKWRHELKPVHYVAIVGYFGNLLPFIFIKRDSFLYHYMPALIFGILLLAVWLDRLWPAYKKILVALIFLILLAFVSLVPLTFGVAVGAGALIQRYDSVMLHVFSSGLINYQPYPTLRLPAAEAK